MTIFERVKELSDKQGKSLQRVSEDLGFSSNYFYRMKKQQPTAEKLKLIADYFNVSVDYLLGRKATFASRLQEIRESLKLSHQEFAHELGVSYETLISWETGGSVPIIDELDMLAETLGVTTDYLLGISNNYGKDYQDYIEKRKKQPIDFSKRVPIQTIFSDLSQDKKETLYDVALKLWNFQRLENEKREIEENKLQNMSIQ